MRFIYAFFLIALAADAFADTPSTPAAERAAFLSRLDEILVHQAEELAKLNSESKRAPSHAAALEIQARIEQIKLSTQIELFEVQLDRARAMGHEKLIGQLTESIERLRERPEPATKLPEAAKQSKPSGK